MDIAVFPYMFKYWFLCVCCQCKSVELFCSLLCLNPCYRHHRPCSLSIPPFLPLSRRCSGRTSWACSPTWTPSRWSASMPCLRCSCRARWSAAPRSWGTSWTAKSANTTSSSLTDSTSCPRTKDESVVPLWLKNFWESPKLRACGSVRVTTAAVSRDQTVIFTLSGWWSSPSGESKLTCLKLGKICIMKVLVSLSTWSNCDNCYYGW